MKKKLVYSLVFILVVFLMVNYSYCVLIGNTSSNELTDSEKALIKKFGWREDYVLRWPDGIVYVYNGTTYKGLPKLIKQINQIIGGKTVFQLNNDEEMSKVIFKSYASIKYAWESHYDSDGHGLKKWVFSIGNEYLHGSHSKKLFLAIFIQVAGFNYRADPKKYGEWWEFSIDKNVEKMLKALYKVPPGYNLLTGKVE